MKKKRKSPQKFRLNITIVYYSNDAIQSFRKLLFDYFGNTSSILKLDFATSENIQVICEPDSNFVHNRYVIDMIYLRSSNQSWICRKELCEIVSTLHNQSKLYLQGVDICYQLQKMHKLYPFPSDFVRHLNYPYLEIHKKEGHTLCIKQ